MSGYYCIVRHVNMNYSSTTYSQFCLKHLAKKSLKKANYTEIPPKTNKKSSPGNFKPNNMLKMTHVRSKKQKCQDKMKGLLALGDITPRTKGNLLETFVSKILKFFFEIKVLIKTSTLAHMSGYYRIVCHVNMNYSGTTYSHFCLKHLAKKALKSKFSRNSPKNKQKLLPWKLRNPKTCLK